MAAILLAVEVLLFEWKPRSFVPVVISVLVAAAWRPELIGQGTMFPAIWPLPTEGWIVAAAAGIGVIVGLSAALLSSLLYRVEDLFHRLPVHWMWCPQSGPVVVGVGGLIDRRPLRSGPSNIHTLVDGQVRLRLGNH